MHLPALITRRHHVQAVIAIRGHGMADLVRRYVVRPALSAVASAIASAASGAMGEGVTVTVASGHDATAQTAISATNSARQSAHVPY